MDIFYLTRKIQKYMFKIILCTYELKNMKHTKTI